MIRITQLKLPVGHTPEQLKKKIAKTLKCAEDTFSYETVRQSLDARHKDDKKFVYTVDVKTAAEQKILRRVHNNNIMSINKKDYQFPLPGTEKLEHVPVIVGSGPAGLFCAWYLARAGYRPLVLERGQEAQKRKETVDRFWKDGVLDPDSNVQFGEGGAGTFSDGKLNTLVKDPNGRNHEVLKRFVEAGAPEEIVYQQKPHLGTDVLIGIVETMRHQIEEMGGSFRFETKVTDLCIENGHLTAVEVNNEEKIPADACVLALGHSARDTFDMLHRRGVYMEPKSFAVGLRMEHPQKMINYDLYGEEENEFLGAASYKVTHTCENGRGVYSFCMCPGGYVVNASSEQGMLAVNGMSYQARDSKNANSALIVTVTPEDFPEEGPLGGISFQRELEKRAWEIGKGKIPVQLFGDYKLHQKSSAFGEIEPQMKGAHVFADVRSILPKEIGDSIEEGVLAFGKKLKGFDRNDAILSGVESRTSSPVRIVRNREGYSNIEGIYPCGEGAGYAGGITSAAMDGIKTAEFICEKFRNF
ncbi:NAD(P)/FAD-dependent oxidoreductase [Blautia obeum]|uniref:NAD(P)/FAD-dependent oxidoreductase n=1 Tax=Blautia obeum TaxID=40520 RepID=UPI000E4B6116|nr:FAD-dependent oxidoreductase [Blautia obeum]RHC85436.1 FAD-dependent oxidoreductase [Blautia obeum]